LQSSGDWESRAHLSSRHNHYLRYLLIEAAWVAVRRDPALMERFIELCKRMKKQEAIIRIAKNLLRRVRHVWLTGEPYQTGVLA
ncbi:transposase, partial [bacterium]|nr:transposase [bacterium]